MPANQPSSWTVQSAVQPRFSRALGLKHLPCFVPPHQCCKSAGIFRRPKSPKSNPAKIHQFHHAAAPAAIKGAKSCISAENVANSPREAIKYCKIAGLVPVTRLTASGMLLPRRGIRGMQYIQCIQCMQSMRGMRGMRWILGIPGCDAMPAMLVVCRVWLGVLSRRAYAHGPGTANRRARKRCNAKKAPPFQKRGRLRYSIQ